jgi:5'-3' exonuclease
MVVEPPAQSRLHVVDGTFELYRAHFAPRPPLTTASGRDVKATLGLLGSLMALLRDAEERVTHLAYAFDNPIVCFRNDLFDGYKTDAGVPPELRGQFDDAERAVAALGVTVWSMREFEADDALATASRLYAESFSQVRILSPDKDLGAALEGDRVVQVDRIRKREIRDVDVMAKLGVRPSQVADLLALVGDSADGIPGVAGFGEKKAAKLLARYGHVEHIPLTPWDLALPGKDRLLETFRASREQALLYKRLATLRFDVPLRESASQLAVPHTAVEREARRQAFDAALRAS